MGDKELLLRGPPDTLGRSTRRVTHPPTHSRSASNRACSLPSPSGVRVSRHAVISEQHSFRFWNSTARTIWPALATLTTLTTLTWTLCTLQLHYGNTLISSHLLTLSAQVPCLAAKLVDI